MSPAVRAGIMLTSGIMALIWIVYAGTRKAEISSAHVCDQCGMAVSLIAMLMLASDLLRQFDR